VFSTEYYVDDRLDENVTDRGCSTLERSEIPTEFYSENLRGRDPLGDLGLAGRIILK
jgi:hypothetical protein